MHWSVPYYAMDDGILHIWLRQKKLVSSAKITG